MKRWTIFPVASLVVWMAAAQSHEKRITPVDLAQRESFSKATNVAVVVGVSDYAPDTGLQRLQYANRDAEALAGELRRQNYTVRLLVNTEATRSRILSAVREAGDVVTRDGTLLFYFSGHGFAPQAGRNFLATYGVTTDELAQDGLSVDDLRQRIQQSPARRKVLFIDACRSEAGKGAGARSFASLSASTGLRMLLSTQMGRISYENDQLQQGVFTYFLLKALRGEAAGADGFVTFRDVSEYVSSSVRQWSFERKQTQVPVEVSDEAAGDFLLGRAAEPAPRPDPTPAPRLPTGSRVSEPAPRRDPTPAPKPATGSRAGIDLTYFAGIHYGDDYNRAIALYGQPKRTKSASATGESGSGKQQDDAAPSAPAVNSQTGVTYKRRAEIYNPPDDGLPPDVHALMGYYTRLEFGKNADYPGIIISYDNRTGKVATVTIRQRDLALAKEVSGSDPLLELIGKPQAAMKSLFGAPQNKSRDILIYPVGLPAGGGTLMLFGDKTIVAIILDWTKD